MEWTAAWLMPVVLLGLCSGWLIIRTVGSLARGLQESKVLTVPMAASQTLTLRQKGALDLYLEGRRGASLSGLDFELRTETGSAIPLKHVVLRTTVSGLSHVRLKVRSLYLPHDGSFILDISGLREGADPRNRIVFARPVGGLVVRHVLALIGLGFLLMGSLVGSVLLLLRHR